MVDHTLMDRAQQLNDTDKVELAYALLRSVSLAGSVTPDVAALIDERVEHADQNPEDGTVWEDLRSELRREYA